MKVKHTVQCLVSVNGPIKYVCFTHHVGSQGSVWTTKVAHTSLTSPSLGPTKWLNGQRILFHNQETQNIFLLYWNRLPKTKDSIFYSWPRCESCGYRVGDLNSDKSFCATLKFTDHRQWQDLGAGSLHLAQNPLCLVALNCLEALIRAPDYGKADNQGIKFCDVTELVL